MPECKLCKCDKLSRVAVTSERLETPPIEELDKKFALSLPQKSKLKSESESRPEPLSKFHKRRQESKTASESFSCVRMLRLSDKPEAKIT